MGTWTPWGTSDGSRRYGPGVMSYSTASHGGFHLSPARNANVHEAVRSKDGWYEEDVDWSVVALTFPELFTADDRASARATLRMYYPESWDALAAAGAVTMEGAA